MEITGEELEKKDEKKKTRWRRKKKMNNKTRRRNPSCRLNQSRGYYLFYI